MKVRNLASVLYHEIQTHLNKGLLNTIIHYLELIGPPSVVSLKKEHK